MIAFLSAALIVSACDRKAEGQSVAVVNGEEITSSELNEALKLVNAPPGTDKKVVTSRVLQAMIDRRLLAQQARADELDRSPEFLSRQRRATEDLLINMLASKKLNTTKLPSATEISNFEASRPEMFAQREFWNISQIHYVTPSDQAVAKQILAVHTLPDLAKVLSANGIEYAEAKTRLSSAVVPHAMYAKIIAMKPGDIFIVPAGQRSVANVIVSKEPVPLTGEVTRPVAVAALRQEQGAKGMEAQIKQLRDKAKIEYKADLAPPK